MKQINLSEYRRNADSQNGEDGVIDVLFRELNIKGGWLVEFGAYDGIYLSNTNCHARNNPFFQRLLIEPVPERFEQLQNNIKGQYDGLTCRDVLLNKNVKTAGENSLNAIFDTHGIYDIALLSIDVDGEDFEIWKSLDLTKYRPKIVIIEFGQWANKDALYSFVKTFIEQGYNLVHVTGNFIFVDRELGASCDLSIDEFMIASGNPEYLLHYGIITEEQKTEMDKRLGEPNIHAEFSKPQICIFE